MRGCVRPRVDVGLAGNTGEYKGSDTMICLLYTSIQTLGVPEIHILNFRKCIQEGTNAVVELSLIHI